VTIHQYYEGFHGRLKLKYKSYPGL